MEIYIYEVKSFNEEGTMDYSVIEGIFANKADAVTKANADIKMQKGFWDGSYIIKDKKTETRSSLVLFSGKGYYKRYSLTRRELQ